MNNRGGYTKTYPPTIDIEEIYSSPKYLKRALNLYDSIMASNYTNGMTDIMILLNDIKTGIDRCEFGSRTLLHITM